jgi:hypothetical protein
MSLHGGLCCPVPRGAMSAAGESCRSIRSPSVRRPTFGRVPALAGRPFTAAVSGAGALSQRLRGAQARSSLIGVPKPEPAHASLRPRNALLAAFLTQDDATKLEGSVNHIGLEGRAPPRRRARAAACRARPRRPARARCRQGPCRCGRA